MKNIILSLVALALSASSLSAAPDCRWVQECTVIDPSGVFQNCTWILVCPDKPQPGTPVETKALPLKPLAPGEVKSVLAACPVKQETKDPLATQLSD